MSDEWAMKASNEQTTTDYELSEREVAALRWLNAQTLGTRSINAMPDHQLEEARVWFQSRKNDRQVRRITAALRARGGGK